MGIKNNLAPPSSALSVLQKLNQLIAGEARFPEQGEESAFRDVAVVLGNHSAAFRSHMVIDKVAARSMVQNEAVLLKEFNDVARL